MDISQGGDIWISAEADIPVRHGVRLVFTAKQSAKVV